MQTGRSSSQGEGDSTGNFRLHMVTWNVGTAEPPSDVTSLLQLDSQDAVDLYVIGLQEVTATPLRFISDLAYDDSWSHAFMATLAPMGYVKVSSIRMQGLLLLLFSKLAHVPFIRDIQTTYTRTGIFGYWGNKGAVSVRLSFYGHMLCFLNCHLAAHMQYATQRVDEFEYILDTQDFHMHNTPHVLDHRVVFWFGDLNFRIADHGMHFLRSAINSNRLNLLWDRDQLTMMKKKEAFLQEFEEGPLSFKPTYKFDRGTENYDTRAQKTWLGFNGKKRKPAWTDRILWRVKPEAPPPEQSETKLQDQGHDSLLKVSQDTYTCDMNYGVSDHKPVIATFRLELQKKCETPLVRVCAEEEWSADRDVIVAYSILEPFPSSTWDWIGLYKVGFKSAKDYVTYTWVKDDEISSSDELIKVYMSKEEIPLLGGEYILCYYSSNMQSIVGISDPFQVQESKAAIEQGLVPENINGLDKFTAN
ncbi:inositol polyphosphate 5-phosphatase K-like isoform X1 [Conger conger]|uniref:inositol polyphosphate 5-phosphatase K-like isoform X1 n=1 Tax=Conger conger TaxID=82655 RepID=UPI002A599876|nr:inositol polyphosphate 5-phosphatase K-like isoform X1 [Conger conger]XP_061104563.1 inositol polyphosphate 5-phosphatase K-like isoform X1 [Conger conger]